MAKDLSSGVVVVAMRPSAAEVPTSTCKGRTESAAPMPRPTLSSAARRLPLANRSPQFDVPGRLAEDIILPTLAASEVLQPSVVVASKSALSPPLG